MSDPHRCIGSATRGGHSRYRDEAVFESCDMVVVADDQAVVVDSSERGSRSAIVAVVNVPLLTKNP
jgi:hypothetical protein